MTRIPDSLEQKAKPVTQAWIRILDYWPAALLASLPLLSLAVAIFPEATWIIWDKKVPLPWVLGVISILIAIIGGVGTYHRAESLRHAQQVCKDLEKDLKDAHDLSAKYQKDVQLALRFAVQQLTTDIRLIEETGGISKLKADIRATLYCHHHERSIFIPIARIAGNPLFEKNGRKEYPDTQGVISMGWQQGAASLIDLPESREKWEAELVRVHAFSPQEAENLGMHSLSTVAVRMDDDQGPVGIIIVESLKKRGVTSRTIDSIYASQWYAPTASLMLSVRESLVPHISDSP